MLLKEIFSYMNLLIYMERSASMGLSLLAFLAGAQPKMMPTAAEKPAPSAIAPMEMTKLVSIMVHSV